jgi:hypothetical protein
MKSSIAFIALFSINASILVSQPLVGLFSNPNIWLLLGINALIITAYYIARIFNNMKCTGKHDFEIHFLSRDLQN